MNDERRIHSRRLVCVAAQLASRTEDDPHLAMLHDISVTGALFLTRAAYEPGEEVDVVLVFGEDHEPSELALAAKTVRVEEVEEDRRDVWRYRVAVAFEHDISEHKALMEQLAAELAAAGLPF